jgi:uncharacterized membrane protein
VVCHCLEVLALAVWVGGLVVIVAAVIPAVFNAPIPVPAGGRLLTQMFHGYDRVVLLSAGVIVVGMGLRAFFPAGGATPVSLSLVVLVGVMVMVAGFLTMYLNPEIVRLQELAFAASEETAKQAAYGDFFRLHRIARALYLINLGLGVSALCLKVRAWVR